MQDECHSGAGTLWAIRGVGLAPVSGQRDLQTQPGDSHPHCLGAAISSMSVDWQLGQGYRKGPGDPNHTVGREGS